MLRYWWYSHNHVIIQETFSKRAGFSLTVTRSSSSKKSKKWSPVWSIARAVLELQTVLWPAIHHTVVCTRHSGGGSIHFIQLRVVYLLLCLKQTESLIKIMFLCKKWRTTVYMLIKILQQQMLVVLLLWPALYQRPERCSVFTSVLIHHFVFFTLYVELNNFKEDLDSFFKIV